jgi:hypothetical protein
LRVDKRKIYVLGNTRYLFRYKIGIAKDVKKREQQIEATLKGDTYEIFSATFYFAFRVEQTMHLIYAPLSAKMKGSGKTEWFYFILPVTPIILLVLVYLLQRFIVLCILIFIIWVVYH